MHSQLFESVERVLAPFVWEKGISVTVTHEQGWQNQISWHSSNTLYQVSCDPQNAVNEHQCHQMFEPYPFLLIPVFLYKSTYLKISVKL